MAFLLTSDPRDDMLRSDAYPRRAGGTGLRGNKDFPESRGGQGGASMSRHKRSGEDFSEEIKAHIELEQYVLRSLLASR